MAVKKYMYINSNKCIYYRSAVLWLFCNQAYRKHSEVSRLLPMGSKAALVSERAKWAVTDCHSQSGQLVVCRVDVHPHDKLAGAGVVHDFGALQHHGGVDVGVGASF